MHVYPWERAAESLQNVSVPTEYGTSSRWGPHGAPEVAKTLASMVSEVTDEAVEAQKPGNRAWILEQLRTVLQVAAEADPDDPRFLKIRLDALDRMARILRVEQPQGAREREGDLDRERLVAAAAAALQELEAKARG